jgi:hypothetical protein
MDLVSLLEKDLNQESKTYFEKTLPSIKFSEIGEHYHKLPLDCRGKVILRMSDNVLTFHRVVMWLPQELQKHIVSYMFGDYKAEMLLKDGEEPTEEDAQKIENIKKYNKKVDAAIEKFCKKKRLNKSVQLFYDIKQMIRKDDPIAPIYVMNKIERSSILNELNPWYGIVADQFMNTEELQWVDELSEDERIYFANKSINKCPGQSEHAFIFCMSCMGAVLLASTATFLCGVSSLCCGMNSKIVPWCMGGMWVGGFGGSYTAGACCFYRSEIKKQIL